LSKLFYSLAEALPGVWHWDTNRLLCQ